ncbi:hypothetical protein [Flindersiella endophytica]
MDAEQMGRMYLDHLSDADLRLLAAASREQPDPAQLRRMPAAVPELVETAEVYDAIYGPAAIASGRPVNVSPFLAFAVAVHRAMLDLATMTYVPEPGGQRGSRLPVFDTPQLRDFLGSQRRRVFLAELLTSFTKVASGRYVVRTRRGLRMRRFSELDLVRMAGLADAAPDAEKPGIYRRLGDLALFLAGVFPDYVRQHALGPVDASRVLRAAHLARGEQDRLLSTPAIELFEYLGERWYRHVGELAPLRTEQLQVVSDVADRFHQARRVLNLIAGRFLFPAGNPWFAPPTGG